MASLGDLFVNIKANTTDFDSNVDGVKTKSEKANTSLTKMASTIKSAFVVTALVKVAAAVKDIADITIAAASDAEETANKFNAVFGDISADAQLMADSLAENYGLSQTASEAMLASTGDLLTGLDFTTSSALDLSAQVATLGTDLASFQNFSGGAEGAVDALTKGLLGERESMKSLGISINETDVKNEILRLSTEGVTFATDKQATAQATLNLALIQSKNSIGDFERSQDSYANQSKIAEAATKDLQVELGQNLLPAATALKTAYSELVGSLATYIGKVNDLRSAEASREAGNESEQQRLLLMDEQISKNDDLITALKVRLATETDMYGIADRVRDQIAALEGQNSSIKTGIGLIEGEIATRVELEDQKKAETIAETEKKELEAEARALREQGYIDQNTAVQQILEDNKSEITLIDEQIAEITKLSLADGTFRDDQLAAIAILQAEKQVILDEDAETRESELAEKQAVIDSELLAEQEKIASIRELEDEWHAKRITQSGTELEQLEYEKEQAIEFAEERGASTAEIEAYYRVKKAELDAAALEAQLTSYAEYSSSLLTIADNISGTIQNNIDADAQAKIDALNEAELGEEAYADAVAAIEYTAAIESWELEKKTLAYTKAAGTFEIAVNTAIGVSKALAQGGIAGIATGVLVAAAGATQAALVLSEEEPTKPTLATGAIIAGSQRGVDVTVGEGGNDELVLGGGAKGEAILSQFAAKIVAEMGNGSSSSTVINNFNGKSLISNTELADFAKKFYPAQIAEQKRRGAN